MHREPTGLARGLAPKGPHTQGCSARYGMRSPLRPGWRSWRSRPRPQSPPRNEEDRSPRAATIPSRDREPFTAPVLVCPSCPGASPAVVVAEEPKGDRAQ